jgi:hypothetical protein
LPIGYVYWFFGVGSFVGIYSVFGNIAYMHFLWLACLRVRGEGEKMSNRWHGGKGEGFNGAALIGPYFPSNGLVFRLNKK